MQDGKSVAQYEFKEACVSNEHERRGEGYLIIQMLKYPFSIIHILSCLDEKEHMNRTQHIWRRCSRNIQLNMQKLFFLVNMR